MCNMYFVITFIVRLTKLSSMLVVWLHGLLIDKSRAWCDFSNIKIKIFWPKLWIGILIYYYALGSVTYHVQWKSCSFFSFKNYKLSSFPGHLSFLFFYLRKCNTTHTLWLFICYKTTEKHTFTSGLILRDTDQRKCWCWMIKSYFLHEWWWKHARAVASVLSFLPENMNSKNKTTIFCRICALMWRSWQTVLNS